MILAVLKVLFIRYEVSGGVGLLCELSIHVSYFGLESGSSFLVNEVFSLLKNLGDHIFADGYEILVQVTTLDQEHRHSDLEGSLLADLGDGAFKSLNLHYKLFILEGSFVQECLDTLVLLQQEKELVVHVHALCSCLQVFIDNGLDGVLGILYNFVIG